MADTKIKRKVEVDMCSGALFPKIIVFFIPIMLSNVLQFLYSAADQVVIGRFAGSDSLAAVGSTGSITSLIVSFVIGLSVGANSIVARLFGAKDDAAVSRAVHTSMFVGIGGGVVIGALGFIFTPAFLRMMNTQPDVMDKAVLYMRITLAGLPLVSIFNFSSAILRAIGDSKRPLYALMISGILNIVLNIWFVVSFHMDVAGVALATIISQTLAGIFAVSCLIRDNGSYKLSLKKLKIHKAEFSMILRIGIPAGFQSSMFAISNVFITTGINSLGKAAITGNTAANNIDAIIYQATNALYHTSLTFCGQNYGAKKFDRIVRSCLICLGIVTAVGVVIGAGCYAFRYELLSVFIKDNEEAISYGMTRLELLSITYFLCGIMDVGCGVLRSINRSVESLVNSVVWACVFRIIWIYTAFRIHHDMFTLFLSYPISWLMTSIFHFVMFAIFFKKMKKEEQNAENKQIAG